MSGYILCQVKRAKNPYYISNISTNIYSIEELCYYLYHNIYLLDETIINEQLLVWMKEELHLRRLYQRLYVLLEEKKNIGEFILPIFKEINYLSHDQFREMNIGCAYASLFQMNEALTCFQKANEELHTKASLKSWLFAVYMSKGQDAYEQMCTERKVDAETRREMDRQITEAMQVELPRDLDEALAAWTREYHKNTGL